MRETMNLDGGIDTYQFYKRYGSGIAPYGKKVVFTNTNGYDTQREVANRHMKEGQVLTVNEIYVGRSDSQVEFVEIPNHKFNTVMFEDYHDPKKPAVKVATSTIGPGVFANDKRGK